MLDFCSYPLVHEWISSIHKAQSDIHHINAYNFLISRADMFHCNQGIAPLYRLSFILFQGWFRVALPLTASPADTTRESKSHITSVPLAEAFQLINFRI